MAGARRPVLARSGRVRARPRRPGRDRAASRLRRLQHRDDAAAARRGGPEHRRELRPVAPLLAADRPACVRARADGRDLPRPREGHRLRREPPRRRRRARDRRAPRRAGVELPLGRRRPPRRVLARPRRRAARRPATTGRSRSSTRIPSARSRTGSRGRWRRCARRSPDRAHAPAASRNAWRPRTAPAQPRANAGDEIECTHDRGRVGAGNPIRGDHAAAWYSWISPPRMSRRRTWSRRVRGLGGGSRRSGGRWLRERCGRCAL